MLPKNCVLFSKNAFSTAEVGIIGAGVSGTVSARIFIDEGVDVRRLYLRTKRFRSRE